MGQLDNKVTLVTGASMGIGLAIGRRFIDEGATVYITGRREAELKIAADQLGENAIPVRSDVADLSDLDALFATIRSRSGRLDVLVASAGVVEVARLEDVTEERYDHIFGINVKGTVFTVQKALPLLPQGASLILLSSASGARSAPAMSVYGASKAAIRSLARSWAAELTDRAIRVNAISPGPIETPGIFGPAGDDLAAQNKHREMFNDLVPLGRMGRPEEVASMALFLASDQGSFSTGGEFFVDGGIAQL